MNTNYKDKVAVAILNWNGVNWLEQFLPIVILNSIDNSHIYVIDNKSTDNSIEFLKVNFPEVSIIENDKNYGFAQGYNEGLKSINQEYCILLNSDVEVTPNWISPIIELMESDKSIAACQPKILDYNNKTQFEYAGAAGGFIDKYGYPFCRGRIFDSLEQDEQQYNNTIEIFWATGACMFVRKEAYINVGQLDNKYFAHMEEIDLCWRLKNNNHKVMFCGLSTVYHVGGGTLQKSNPKKTFLNFRNSLLTLYKNAPKNKVRSLIFTRLLLDGIAGIKYLLSGNMKDMFAILKAHFSFYKLMSSTPKSTAKNYPTAVYQSNIVFNYFLKGKKKFSDLDFLK